MRKKITSFLIGVLCLVNTSYAALNDVGGGLVNDTTQNITWLKDGNVFKTICDANINDPIMVSYNALTPYRSAATTCSMNGLVIWDDAEKFIAALNSNNYLDHDDWRQPAVIQPDSSCDSQQTIGFPFPDQGSGYNCTAVGSELSHMFNVSLANPNDGDGSNCLIGGVPQDLAPLNCFQNVGPFTNAYAYVYWSGTEFAPDISYVWTFYTRSGEQTPIIRHWNGGVYVWPVRSGLAPVPVPPQAVPTMPMWALVLTGLLLIVLAPRRLVT